MTLRRLIPYIFLIMISGTVCGNYYEPLEHSGGIVAIDAGNIMHSGYKFEICYDTAVFTNVSCHRDNYGYIDYRFENTDGTVNVIWSPCLRRLGRNSCTINLVSSRKIGSDSINEFVGQTVTGNDTLDWTLVELIKDTSVPIRIMARSTTREYAYKNLEQLNLIIKPECDGPVYTSPDI